MKLLIVKDESDMSILRYKRCKAMGMTKPTAVEFPEKLSANHLNGVDGVQERQGNGHTRLSVDEAEGEVCIVCRFVLDHPQSHNFFPHFVFIFLISDLCWV